MRGFKLRLNIIIFFLILVFTGCAATGPGINTQPKMLVNPDAIIHFVNHELNDVTPVAVGHLGKKFVWKITPPGPVQGHSHNARVCIKQGYPVPFTEPEWQDRCEDGNKEIDGTIDSTLQIPPGQQFLEIQYSAYDTENGLIIDPTIRVYH